MPELLTRVNEVSELPGVPADRIVEGDCIQVMRKWPDSSFDHCITDPPFNMSKKKGLGWAFSSHITMQEAWDMFSKDDYLRFTGDWIQEVSRLVKPNGNIFIFGTYHNIYIVGFTIQRMNLRIVNSIVWFKPNAQPNITGRMLTESTEQIIWVCNNTEDKAKNWVFNYAEAKVLGNGRQLRNMWEIPYAPAREKKFGKSPAQKPEALLERLLRIGTHEGDTVLDCFAGSGTTGVVAERLNRQCVMIEKDPVYAEIGRRRLFAQRSMARNEPGPSGPATCDFVGVPAVQPNLLEATSKYIVEKSNARRGEDRSKRKRIGKQSSRDS